MGCVDDSIDIQHPRLLLYEQPGTVRRAGLQERSMLFKSVVLV
jgi:hypothetical protein